MILLLDSLVSPHYRSALSQIGLVILSRFCNLIKITAMGSAYWIIVCFRMNDTITYLIQLLRMSVEERMFTIGCDYEVASITNEMDKRVKPAFRTHGFQGESFDPFFTVIWPEPDHWSVFAPLTKYTKYCTKYAKYAEYSNYGRYKCGKYGNFSKCAECAKCAAYG